MTTDQVYDRLRSIGCSVETSDALAPIVAELSDRKREAFFLWACGMSEEDAGKSVGINQSTVSRMIKALHKNAITLPCMVRGRDELLP